MCALRVSFIVRFFTSLNLPTPADPSLHSSSHSAGEQALHLPNFHFTPRRHNAHVCDHGRARSPPSPQSRLRPSKMECSSHPIRGEITSALTPPHHRRMSPISTLGKTTKEPLSGEEHRDADTPRSSNRGWPPRHPKTPHPIRRRVTGERIPPPRTGEG